MRRQDEIRLLFPSQDRMSQKFLLSELAPYSGCFDTEESLAFLSSQVRRKNGLIRHQAIATSSRFLPPTFKRRFLEQSPVAGVWSGYIRKSQKSPLGESGKSLLTPQQVFAIRRRALDLFDPVLETIIQAIGNWDEPRRALASMVLSFAPRSIVLSGLKDRIRSGRSSFDLLWALSHAGIHDSDQDFVLEQIETRIESEPDLALAAYPLSDDRLTSLIQKSRGRLDRMGTVNLTLAASNRPLLPLDVYEDLSRFDDPWARIYLLRAVESGNPRSAMDIVNRIASTTDREFVRLQCVRAAGGLKSLEAVEFIKGHLVHESHAIRGQAIESLIRRGIDGREFAESVSDLLGSAHIGARTNALLATMRTPTPRHRGLLESMFLSPDPLERIEAAFCLGFIPKEKCAGMLRLIALQDPDGHVRIQAIKSLSRHPVQFSQRTLLEILLRGEPSQANLASHLLPDLPGTDSAELGTLLVRAIMTVKSGGRRGVLLHLLGRVLGRGGDIGEERIFEKALEEGDGDLALGALEGLKLLRTGTRVDIDGLTRKFTTGDMRLRSPSLVVRFLAGYDDSIDGLCAELESGDEERIARALKGSLEILLIIQEVLDDSFVRLATLTDDHETSEADVPRPWGDRACLSASPVASDPEDVFGSKQDSISSSFESVEANLGIANADISQISGPIPNCSSATQDLGVSQPAVLQRVLASTRERNRREEDESSGGKPGEGVEGETFEGLEDAESRNVYDELKKSYAAHRIIEQPLAPRVEAATSILPDKKMREELATRAIQGFQSILSGSLGWKAPLFVIALIIVGSLAQSFISIRIGDADPGSGGDRPPGNVLVITKRHGPVNVSGRALGAGAQWLRTGQGIRLGDGGVVRWESVHGDWMSIDGPGEVAIVDVGDNSSEIIVAISGCSTGFDFGPGREIVVEAGSYMLGAQDAAFSVVWLGDGFRVACARGSVRISHPDRPAEVVGEGSEVRLDTQGKHSG